MVKYIEKGDLTSTLTKLRMSIPGQRLKHKTLDKIYIKEKEKKKQQGFSS